MRDGRSPGAVDVLVVGEALVDIVETAGIRTEHPGGSPANVALGLGRRGVSIGLLTQLADDDRGRAIREHLQASGVHVLADSFRAEVTSTAVARIGADGQAAYDFDVAWGRLAPIDRLAPTLVHTGSVAAFLAPGAESVRDLLRSAEAAEVTFDPNIRPALLGSRSDAVSAFETTAKLATVVKMSDEDAGWLYPDLTPDHVLDHVLALGVRMVAVTRGADGAILATPHHRIEVPPVRVRTIDTIGAGDTFMAALIHSVLIHGSATLDATMLRQMGEDAVASAAITVSRAGADLPWARELAPPT
ncbi:carbohydrate kinase family protein [Microbacterium memoriense]|uniref:Carbohydrate kinase n=1 Tax=Microbacterium memoriense TaxID=2978350 RepID=A0ABT2PCP5_9MICO|nr:carbohydrate kinase [Microbacterium memoriense]MCT9002361.1 carbohydrate kinase [Microbacterium memoriense]